MIKVWEDSKVAVYFEDIENETLVRQGFNNLISDVTEEDMKNFVETIGSLHELPTAHAVVTESYRYLA